MTAIYTVEERGRTDVNIYCDHFSVLAAIAVVARAASICTLCALQKCDKHVKCSVKI